MVFHLVRDLRRRSWFHCIRHKQVCGRFFQHHASHRHSGLVYLPSWIFLRISHGQCRGRHSKFCEQDCILPGHLEFCQEVHPRKGRCCPPPTVRSPINLIIEAWCRISKASRYLLLWPFSSALMHTTLSSPFSKQDWFCINRTLSQTFPCNVYGQGRTVPVNALKDSVR